MTSQIGVPVSKRKRSAVKTLISAWLAENVRAYFARICAREGRRNPRASGAYSLRGIAAAKAAVLLLGGASFAAEPSLPVDKFAAKTAAKTAGKLPTWQSHARKGTNGGKWNAKCSAGKSSARNNPHKAAIHPPACTRL